MLGKDRRKKRGEHHTFSFSGKDFGTSESKHYIGKGEA